MSHEVDWLVGWLQVCVSPAVGERWERCKPSAKFPGNLSQVSVDNFNFISFQLVELALCIEFPIERFLFRKCLYMEM